MPRRAPSSVAAVAVKTVSAIDARSSGSRMASAKCPRRRFQKQPQQRPDHKENKAGPEAGQISRETNGRPCTIVALTRLFVEGCQGERPAANLPHACHLCRSGGHRLAHGGAPGPAARAHRLQPDDRASALTSPVATPPGWPTRPGKRPRARMWWLPAFLTSR